MKGQAAPSIFDPFTRFLRTKTGRKIKSKALPFVILCILGLIATMGTPAIPFIGLPALRLPYLGAALILWAVHSLFPSESEAMEGTVKRMCSICGSYTAKPETIPATAVTPGRTICSECRADYKPIVEHFVGAKNWGPMYAKSFIKLLAIIFLMIQFFQLHILLALATAFIAYFSLPTRYDQTRPYKAAGAWFRMGLGVVFAALLTIFLTPSPDVLFTAAVLVPVLITIPIALAMVFIQVSTKKQLITIIVGLIIIVIANAAFIGLARVPSLAMFYLTIAFFATTPEREKAEEPFYFGKAREVQGRADRLAQWMSGKIDKMEDQWVAIGTGIFLAFAILAGIPILGSWLAEAAGEIRWIVGIVWVTSLFVGSMAGREGRPYIGVVMLIFAMMAFSFAYTDTVGAAVFGPYWGTVEATGEMFFGPIAQSMDRANCEAWATWVCIREGPVACSEARLKCQVTVSEPVGAQTAIEFQNFKTEPREYYVKGENTIYFELVNNGDFDAMDVTLEVPEENGRVTRVVGVEEPVKVGRVEMDEGSCIGGNYTGDNTCVWFGAMPKGGRGAALITINWDKAEKDKDVGLFPEVKLEASYDYTVRSSYKVDVRSADEMRRLLLAGEAIAGEVAQFSGGPVSASLWTPKYIETGKPTLVTASLTNTKMGTAENPVYCVYVPEEADIVPGSEKPKRRMDITGGDCPAKPKTKAVKCWWDEIPNVTAVEPETAKPLNTKTCSFRMSIDIGPAPQKQLAMVGEADYHYVVTHIKKDIMMSVGVV